MSNPRRQRHKLLLITTLLVVIVLTHQAQFCSAQLVASFSTLAQHNQAPANILAKQQQYSSINSPQQQRSSNNLLVSGDQSAQHNQHIAQSLPLTRLQRQQQQPDLDNVIESTTSLNLVTSIIGGGGGKAVPTTPTTSCQLPPTWTGKWYQSNREPIRVTNTEISDKGLCRDQKGDKFLFEYNGGRQQQQQQQSQATAPCLMCLVINERHLNVLQYKESSCQPIPPNYNSNRSLDDDHSLLDSICSDINGDAQLESLFRLDTPAIECPISGQYSFSYDTCREPQSQLDSCIDKKQLNFKFSACQDVSSSESKSEVLKCYADWSEGNNYYMIGRLEHASNQQDKGKFRCFVYEKSADGKSIQMAQSLEETCYGLINANEGPKILRLTAKPPTMHKCHFPSYIQSQSDNWLSVDNSLIYMFNQNSTRYQVKETKEGNVIEEATCLQQFTYPQASHAHPLAHHQHARVGNNQQSSQQAITNRRFPSTAVPQVDQSSQQQQILSRQSAPSTITNDVVYLVQITKNCYTTNYCVRFHKRSSGIVQIDYFISSPSDGQCRNAFIGTPSTQIITSTNLEHQRCPFEGAYTIEAPIESDLTYNPSNIFICPRQSFLTAQCDHPSRLRIHSRCSPQKFLIKNLYCLGSWTTNGLVRLLLADDDRQRYSAWYRDYGAALQPPQDGAANELPQAQALQQQQPSVTTRSQQLLAAASTPSHQQLQVAPIVDLQIALITPMQIVAKPMQVRLTRRNQCSELRGYMNQGAYGSPMSSVASSPMQGYAGSSSSSAAATNYHTIHHRLSTSGLLLIVIIFMPFTTQALHYRHYHL